MKSDFYRKLSEYYDDIFPLEKSVLSFLVECLPAGGRVLDLACGTGTYSMALSEQGFASTGVELDGEMIAAAKSKDDQGTVMFVHGDMTEYNGLLPAYYDGVICIGNSLPHLAERAQVIKSFEVWNKLLAKPGALIIQMVNFRKFARGVPADLPTIKTTTIEFKRRYLPADDNHVSFDTELRVIGDNSAFRSAVDLLILDKSFVDTALHDTGFRNIRYYGNYAGEPYDPETSFLLIAVAEKNR